MAGGRVKYRHLSRSSAHRQALLRNLVTSLVKNEAIRTSWAKAKEAQSVADRLITLAKRNNETARRKAQGILFTPLELMPKLFGELRRRYATRPGGYTRVLRTVPKSDYDQGDSAILELVDGPKDMRQHMTAAAVARDRALKRPSTELTLRNRAKVTRYRAGGDRRFEDLVLRMGGLGLSDGADDVDEFKSLVEVRKRHEEAFETWKGEVKDAKEKKMPLPPKPVLKLTLPTDGKKTRRTKQTPLDPLAW